MKPSGRAAFGLAAVLLACAPAHDAERLFADLKSPDAEVRQEAGERLEAILRQGDHRVFTRGLDSPTMEYRIQSILFLARMPQPEARAALRRLLRVETRAMLPYNPIRLKPSSETADSRILVASLIARNGGDPQAIDEILAGMDAPQPADAVAGACYAIGALRDPKGLPFLRSAVAHPDVEVVRAAVQALGHLRHGEALRGLEAAAAHPDVAIRSEVLSSLALHEGPESLALVRRLAADDPAAELRTAALRLLERAPDPEVTGFLIERLRDRDPAARAAALRALEGRTGQRLGPSPERWARWWKAQGARRGGAR